jgi:hypothetical protein
MNFNFPNLRPAVGWRARERAALEVETNALIGDPAIHYEKRGCDDKADYIFGIER